MLVDEATTVDDAEHERLMAKAAPRTSSRPGTDRAHDPRGIRLRRVDPDGQRLEGVCRRANPLPLDSLGMWEATAGLPEQIGAAASPPTGRAASTSACRRRFANVVVLGMGGSGVAGDMLAALAGAATPVPVWPVKSYDAPAFVGPDTLVFAVSCSGDTEETVSAAAAALASAGATVVAVTGGGRLAELAAERRARRSCGARRPPPAAGRPRGPGRAPARGPRAPADLAARGRRPDRLGVAQLERRRRGRLVGSDEPGPRSPGASAAPSPSSTVARARRRRAHAVEDPGQRERQGPGLLAVQPELCHNEMAGWGQHGDVTRQVLTLVALRLRRRAPPGGAPLRRLVDELLLEVVADDVIEVWAAATPTWPSSSTWSSSGTSSRSTWPASEGIDPGPVPILGELKDRSSEPARARLGPCRPARSGPQAPAGPARL